MQMLAMQVLPMQMLSGSCNYKTVAAETLVFVAHVTEY
jgi:hypothetical protein